LSNLWLLDQDPYGQRWLAVLDLRGFSGDRDGLLDAAAYCAVLRARI
jgi:glycine cleavage system H lipoate-binding protein